MSKSIRVPNRTLALGTLHRSPHVRRGVCHTSGRRVSPRSVPPPPVWSTISIDKRTGNRSLAFSSHATVSLSTPPATVDDEITYRVVEDTEAPENYVLDGFHPVQVGDVFLDGRYTVVHKLGFGGFSTVWLARDQQDKQYVSLKICCASRHQELRELQVLNLIKSRPDSEPGKGYTHLVLNSFEIEGPNGSHQCLISPVARISAFVSKAASEGIWLFPMPVARAMTAQLILAVEYLHSLGIAHGDLHKGNVLLTLPDISSLTVDEIYNRYGKPVKEPIERVDGKPIPPNVPSHILPSIWMGKACEDLLPEDAGILVTDFGEAWRPSIESRYYQKTPRLCRAPESLLSEKENRPIGFPADVWSLACLIYELFSQLTLFECFRPDADDVFAENICMLGKPPARWWDIWDVKGEFFDKDGEWSPARNRLSCEAEYLSLDGRMAFIAKERGDDMTAEELKDLQGLLEPMLRWLPEDRVTMKELSTGHWMQKWGKPALETMEAARRKPLN